MTKSSFVYTVKGFQVLLFNTNNSTQHYSYICTWLNGSKYRSVIQIIQFNISHLFAKIKTKIKYIYLSTDGTLTGSEWSRE